MKEIREIDTPIAESFRDKLGTIDKEGKRAWVFPNKPKGRHYNLRTYFTIFYLIVFFGLPFIKLHGEPLFLLNILERKFIIFGMIFWPQDFFIFGVAMLIFIVFTALFTVVYGRVFCGWACPQTIFMEMLFRRIEYWIEGDANKQRALASGAWTSNKAVKRVFKFSLFYLLSYIISATLLSYLIGIEGVFNIIAHPFSGHKAAFVALLIFTTVFFFVFAWFREQVCLIVCPYGRMQGVLLDKDTVVVAYDYERGEPRGKVRKNDTHTKGDCVDCNLCVKVCPTGMDIRNGTQLECINCTACVDACDNVMASLNRPAGLIRFDSENGIKNKTKLKFTTRMKAYSAVLILLVCVEVFLLVSRTDYDATILRAKGMLYQDQPNNQISNLYTIKLINKTRDSFPVNLKVEDINGTIKIIGKDIIVKKESIAEGEFFVYLDKNEIRKRKTPIKIGLYSNNKKIKTVKTNFLGPVNVN